MAPATALLALGGAISLLLGVLTGFWLQSWMRHHPGRPAHHHRLVAHREALWSSFLCFGVAALLDRLPGPAWSHMLVAAALLATGWGAVGQYVCIARSEVEDVAHDPVPAGASLGGAVAMAGTIVSVVLLLALCAWAAAGALR